MSKIWAEVSHGNFQTVDKRDPKDKSEPRFRLIATVKGYCPFTVFNSQLSAWVNIKGYNLHLPTLWKVYQECLELLRKNPDNYQSKRKLFLAVSKIGLDKIERNPNVFLIYLKEYNKVVDRILWSPRVLMAEGKKKWLDFTFHFVILPGLRKHHFPEVAFIGVGYRDKGHCRKNEHDGSPDWREIALDEKFQADHLQVRPIPKNRTLRLIQSDDLARIRWKAERRFSKFKRDLRESLLI